MSLDEKLIALAREVSRSSSPFTVTPLTGQASARAYHRVRAGDLSYVAMVMPKDALKSDEATSGGPPPELPFLNVHRYLAAAGVPVPAIHRVALEDGILLLEDLGDVTLEAGLARSPPAELYGPAIDLLADLRARAEAHPDPACLAFGRGFDEALYRWEFDHYVEYGLTARTGSPPTAAEQAVLTTAAADICARLAALPRGFTHRDYQSRNLMLARRGLVVIDFQDALLGPRQYDLVALLRDSYVELPDKLVDDLIARYVDRLATLRRERIDARAFRELFDVLTVQRKLKDGGRFEYIDRVKKNPSFLPHVPASFRYVARALERVPAYGELLRLLRDRHPEMR